MIQILIGIIAVVILGTILANYFLKSSEGFASNIKSYKEDPSYKKQLAALHERFDPVAGGRRPISDLLTTAAAPPAGEDCLVNFYALATRFTGYIGPFDNGYFDPDEAVAIAMKAGCRTFVLEIDYIETCEDAGGKPTYFPKLVVRDERGRLRTNPLSDEPKCQSIGTSNITAVAKAIASTAFAQQTQNRTDPIIIVLYGLRMPPKAASLEYMSNIAKCLQPLLDYHVDNLVHGGTFTRQKQEGQLLINSITDYQARVLLFANMDTSAFRDAPPGKYAPKEDLDYLVNLRLTYKQTQMGCTCPPGSGSYGILEAADDFLIIPPDRIEDTADELKLKWTLALSKDPSQPVTSSTYKSITSKFGVHCVPINLWDTNNTFMYDTGTFKTYSFIPKPEQLRYRKPPVAVPAAPSPAMNANGGTLRAPVVASK
jgi:hypothetical protein